MYMFFQGVIVAAVTLVIGEANFFKFSGAIPILILSRQDLHQMWWHEVRLTYSGHQTLYSET